MVIIRQKCQTWQEVERLKKRVEWELQTAIIIRPTLPPGPRGRQIPPAWLVFVEGRYVASCWSEAAAETTMERALKERQLEPY